MGWGVLGSLFAKGERLVGVRCWGWSRRLCGGWSIAGDGAVRGRLEREARERIFCSWSLPPHVVEHKAGLLDLASLMPLGPFFSIWPGPLALVWKWILRKRKTPALTSTNCVYRLREGVGIATCNVAEYRAVILGLKHALEKGYTHIRVKGDSKLVCMQIRGLWKTKNQNMADLCQVAKGLEDKFVSFDIKHVPREYNAEADVQANRAIILRDGQVEVDLRAK